MDCNKIIQGSCEEVMKTFPNGIFSCSISSPPYWALRDYGVEGQLGLEPTFEEYIDKLCNIYDEVKRVLRKDGCVFVNLGDTYNSHTVSKEWAAKAPEKKLADSVWRSGGRDSQYKAVSCRNSNIGLPDKCLCLIPQRFAIEMVNRGWILRNVIIWHKPNPNPMPSSAKDRFTVDFEYVFFFVKNKRYWFEPQYEISVDPESHTGRRFRGPKAIYEHKGYAPHQNPQTFDRGQNELLGKTYPNRNKRTVWTIPTQPYSEAHFATFPEKLVEPMILSGCPEFVCKKCGKAREKIWEKADPKNAPTDYKTYIEKPDNVMRGDALKTTMGGGHKRQQWLNEHPPTFKGYTDCGCNAGWRPGVCLDLFRRKRHGRSSCRLLAA